MDFNPAPATVMHVDINSCFATVEQQANPALRGRPTAVAAYAEDHGCILAASREAKALGIKTGMRVWEAKNIYRNIAVLPPDPDKYRFVNRQLKGLLESYSSDLSVESIDEMVLSLTQTPALDRMLSQNHPVDRAMERIAREMKRRISEEIGEWITVSIGIAPNRYLAKIASGLHKPDGLDAITKETIEPILKGMKLEDLCGIKAGNADRLRIAGIYTPQALFHADSKTLVRAFRSIVGSHWYLRLHGWEDGSRYTSFGTRESEQKSFGHSHALGTPYLPADPKLWQVLSQLVVKMGSRLRAAGCTACGVGVSALFDKGAGYWHTQELGRTPIFADADMYGRIHGLLLGAPSVPVRILAVYCYRLGRNLYGQQSLFESDVKKEQVTKAIDAISARWGDFAVTPARMLNMEQKVLDRISFGRVREMNRNTETV